VKRRIVLLGPPASGKGTQAEMIAEKYQIPSASPGAMLREEKRRGTALGIEAERLTASGRLVPDDVICDVVRRWLEAHDGAFVFDGFPRSRGQADALEEMLAARGTSLEVVLSLDADYETIANRVQNRVVCGSCRTNLSTGLHVTSVESRCPKCGGPLTRRGDDNLETLRRSRRR
jgi:adenylate kinase